ncbi:ATPase, partial [Methanobrevibacter sp.]|uniref:ATPase n=1 Tax=Methanobrevibacter sp. TaxID=66852 RepID=UPI00388DC4AE
IMNGITILLWVTIFIIGLIASISVKLHYKGDELEKDETSIISKESINGILSFSKDKESHDSIEQNYSQPPIDNTNYIEEIYPQDNYDNVASEVENNKKESVEYESQNQVLINYENEVKKFQEPMNEYQVEIMTQDNNQNEKTELKDLFTIDELIKESKRKDSEREKEAQQIKRDDDAELNELKESIISKKENEHTEEQLIEEILADEEIGKILSGDDADEKSEEAVDAAETKEETIQDIIDSTENKNETIQNIIDESETKEEAIQDVIDESEAKEEIVEDSKDSQESVQDILDVETQESETPLVASQKDIDEAISTASQEIEEEKIESISGSDDITDALLNSEETIPEIKEPVLKSPTKIEEKDEFGSSIDNSNKIEPDNDLDYRKDLARFTNKIKSSSIFKEVKEKLSSEPTTSEEIYPRDNFEETYIRNVNDYEEYDEYAPIINETHDEFGETYEPDYDQVIREENTRKLFNNTKMPEPEIAEPKVAPIKSTPSRANMKIQINNSEAVLKKGDEIIFKHDGETYSSQVYAINGDDISVKYRGKNIKIKPSDVKKIY